MINLRKLAEQQKNQRAEKFKSRILKQTHDEKLAESFSPITKNLGDVNESTKKLDEIVENSGVEDGNTQTPAIEIITGTQSLRDDSTLMKRSKNFFIFQELKFFCKSEMKCFLEWCIISTTWRK